VDSLFGVSLVSILLALLLMMAVIFGILGWIAWRQPVLVRMGLRNAIRRPAQTTLIVVGLMLSTLIISAAFSTGDTVGYSITNTIYESFEDADLLIAYSSGEATARDDAFLNDDFLAALRQQFGADPDVDGITGLLAEQVPVLNEGARLSEPGATVVGVNAETADAFNSLRTEDGAVLPASALSPIRVYITTNLAEEINAGVGDTITVFVDNAPHRFEVLDIVGDTGLTTAVNDPTAGGVVVPLETARQLFGREGQLSLVAMSVTGGVRDNLELGEAVNDRVDDYLEANPAFHAEVVASKHEFVRFGELAGSLFVTFFLIFGLFSIAAGIMLIFLIFVMLAAERRAEMGMARAVGMSRLHLTQSFIAEGMAYNIGSAAVGGLLGIGVAALLVFVLGRVADDFGLSITFHFNWQAFLIAYSLGVVLTFVTVAFSAYRVANLNIVRAIRDIQEPEALRATDASFGVLLRSVVAVLSTLGWIVLSTILAVLTFNIFIFGLATYGIALVAGGLILAFYAYGAMLVSRGVRQIHGPIGWLTFAAWMLLFPITQLTWLLLATQGWAGRYRNAGGWAIWMLAIGALLIYLGGWVWGQAFAYSSGFTLVVLAVAMLAVYFGAGPRLTFSIAGAGLVWYWLLPLPFSVFMDPAAQEDTDPIRRLALLTGLPEPKEISGNIEMFFVAGICITAAATLTIIFNAQLLVRLVAIFERVLGGIAPALKMAIAYPLASRFRTAMTMAMFGLVVFSLIVMATLNSNFDQIFLGDDADAGYDVFAIANPQNRIPDLREALTGTGYDVAANIDAVGTLVEAPADFRQPGARDPDQAQDFQPYGLFGGDAEFYANANLSFNVRATGYETDAEVLVAIQNDPSLVFADDLFLGLQDGAFGPDLADRFAVEDGGDYRDLESFEPIAVEVRDPRSGAVRTVSVIGILEPTVTGILPLTRVFTTREVIDQSYDGGEQELFLLNGIRAGKQASVALARDVESSLLERGVQADSIEQLIDDAAGQSMAFQLLFEGFMGLGLIVGIAALGVIAFRTVVERRQQIGMLRAIGYTQRLVALTFFLESSFIAASGIGMGLILGLALAYNLLTDPAFAGGTAIDFGVPWVRILVICGVAYIASALLTLIPSRSASNVAVAEALRYE